MAQPFSNSRHEFCQSLSIDEIVNGELEFNLLFKKAADSYRESDGVYRFSIEQEKDFVVPLLTESGTKIRSNELREFYKAIGARPGARIAIALDDPKHILIKREKQSVMRNAESTTVSTLKSDRVFPLNTILYGPPGTGKTYTTAARAVEICDGTVDLARADLMRRYEELRQEGRITFVTFHQSYGYEEFVEGLRPFTNEQGQISYRVVPGAFRRACDSANLHQYLLPRLSSKPLQEHRYFAMLLSTTTGSGELNALEFGLKNGCLGLDLGCESGIHKAPEENYRERGQAMKSASTELDYSDTRDIQCFKNELSFGDIVILHNGAGKIGALAEVIGDYECHEAVRFCHRRKVRWLAFYENGKDAIDIVQEDLAGGAIEEMATSRMQLERLTALLSAQTSEPNGPPHLLIIDEINRANISKVFGELITLLEPDKRAGRINALHVKLPYSGSDFCVPSNLYVMGTMNTSDRSIALLDTALRRRFDFEELQPDCFALPAEPVDGVQLRLLLQAINERIEYLYDRDHTIGHAYLIGVSSLAELEQVFRRRIIPLLQEYFYEDWSKVRAVLNDAEGRFIEMRDGMPRGLATFVDAHEAKPRYGLKQSPFPAAAFLKIYE